MFCQGQGAYGYHGVEIVGAEGEDELVAEAGPVDQVDHDGVFAGFVLEGSGLEGLGYGVAVGY